MAGRRRYFVLEAKAGARSHKKWGPYYTYEKASEVRDKLVFQAGKYGLNLHFGITSDARGR